MAVLLPHVVGLRYKVQDICRQGRKIVISFQGGGRGSSAGGGEAGAGTRAVGGAACLTELWKFGRYVGGGGGVWMDTVIVACGAGGVCEGRRAGGFLATARVVLSE
jgi:hypothetical protein